MSGSDDAVYFSTYAEIPRIAATDLVQTSTDDLLKGATVFVDSDPAIVGAAAVVINRAHTFTDLYVPLTHFEASVYAQIDGQTSCRDLVAAESDAQRVADIMLKLWRSDQIIFDRSTV